MRTKKATKKAAKKKAATKKSQGMPFVESPTWSDVKHMATEVMAKLNEFALAPERAGRGGPKRGAADILSWRAFYTLAILSSLMTEGSPRAEALGKRKVIS